MMGEGCLALVALLIRDIIPSVQIQGKPVGADVHEEDPLGREDSPKIAHHLADMLHPSVNTARLARRAPLTLDRSAPNPLPT